MISCLIFGGFVSHTFFHPLSQIHLIKFPSLSTGIIKFYTFLLCMLALGMGREGLFAYPDCHRIVTEVWNRPCVGCPLSIVSQKLKVVKVDLKHWNKHVFDDVNMRVSNALANLQDIQQKFTDEGFSDDVQVEGNLAQLE